MSPWLVLGFTLLLAGAAHAEEPGPAVLSFRDGVPAELLGKTLGIARGLFALSLILGLLGEAFGGAPAESKSYGGVAWRALLVLALLSGYRVLFGSVVTTAQSVADRIAPPRIYAAFAQHNIEALEKLRTKESAERDESSPLSAKNLLSSSRVLGGYVGGALFDGLVLLLVAVGQALHWAFTQFTRILISVLYILGPLALVFHVRAASDVARRWVRAFVTVCVWPILSALLLAIATALLMGTDDAAVFGQYAKAFGALATTLLMVVMCLAVPVLASALVGGSIKNLPLSSLVAATLAVGATVRAVKGVVAKLTGGGDATAGTAGGHGGGPGDSGGSETPVLVGSPAAVRIPPARRASAPLASSLGVPPHGTEPSRAATPLPSDELVADASAPGGGALGPPVSVGPPSAPQARPRVREPTPVMPNPWAPRPEVRVRLGRLPRVGGIESKDLVVPRRPGEVTGPIKAGVTTPLPERFRSADWDDVGR